MPDARRPAPLATLLWVMVATGSSATVAAIAGTAISRWLTISPVGPATAVLAVSLAVWTVGASRRTGRSGDVRQVSAVFDELMVEQFGPRWHRR